MRATEDAMTGVRIPGVVVPVGTRLVAADGATLERAQEAWYWWADGRQGQSHSLRHARLDRAWLRGVS